MKTLITTTMALAMISMLSNSAEAAQYYYYDTPGYAVAPYYGGYAYGPGYYGNGYGYYGAPGLVPQVLNGLFGGW